MTETFAKIDNARRAERQADAATHRRIYPRHRIDWHNGEPFYCAGDHPHDADDHDWQPVPHYGRNHG